MQELSHQRQYNLVVYYIKKHNLHLPSARQLNEFMRQVDCADWDRQPQLPLGTKHALLKQKNLIFIHDLTI